MPSYVYVGEVFTVRTNVSSWFINTNEKQNAAAAEKFLTKSFIIPPEVLSLIHTMEDLGIGA